ncbi:hypothetical protein K440DRAFT_629756 [Wilcoxina mikolae CBS 423.85]|nr:hypothetical protein K440DRAFT_629756 [Wilcoxina mikolae CBS 423.85]
MAHPISAISSQLNACTRGSAQCNVRQYWTGRVLKAEKCKNCSCSQPTDCPALISSSCNQRDPSPEPH